MTDLLVVGYARFHLPGAGLVLAKVVYLGVCHSNRRATVACLNLRALAAAAARAVRMFPPLGLQQSAG